MLSTSIQNKIVKFIIFNWNTLPFNSKPWGIWIRYYLAIPFNQDCNFYGDPIAVWFIAENGKKEKNIWDWKRFETIHFIQPWCMKIFREPYSKTIATTNKIYEIGFAGFAPFESQNDFYIEFIWGGLSAFGYRVVVDENDEIKVETLWIA